MNLLHLFFPLALLLFSTSTIAQVQSLCEKNERVVWSCRAGIKYYSLCASGDLSSSSGYMQYRAGRRGAIEFRFPADQQHLRNYFKYRLLPYGAALTFRNGGYSYGIYEDLKGEPSIEVLAPNGRSRSIDCAESTHSLTLTSTIEYFSRADVKGDARE